MTNQHEHLTEELEIDDDFKPFISQVVFFLTGSGPGAYRITILRDTGAKNSLARCGTFLGPDILWFRHLGLGSWTA